MYKRDTRPQVRDEHGVFHRLHATTLANALAVRWKRDFPQIDRSINLFAIKGHRPLTNHTNSTNITTERKVICCHICWFVQYVQKSASDLTYLTCKWRFGRSRARGHLSHSNWRFAENEFYSSLSVTSVVSKTHPWRLLIGWHYLSVLSGAQHSSDEMESTVIDLLIYWLIMIRRSRS